MKADPLRTVRQHLEQYSGYVLASAWLQCGPAQGINGPFATLGGRSHLGSNGEEDAAWNTNIDVIHSNAGVLWWFE